MLFVHSTSSLLFMFVFCSSFCFVLVSLFIAEFIFPIFIFLICLARVLVLLMKDLSFSWGHRFAAFWDSLPASEIVSRKPSSSRMNLGIAHLPCLIWGVFRSYILTEASWWSVSIFGCSILQSRAWHIVFSFT